MKRIRQFKRLNRADIVNAFSAPDLTRRETMDIVKQYMGNSPVPPAWSYASVRGTFGKRVARHWARHLRHRPAGTYRDTQTGRVLHPVVQTAYDFGSTPEKLAALSNSMLPTEDEGRVAINRIGQDVPFILDEYHKI